MDRRFFKQRRMLLLPSVNLTITLTGTWDNSGTFGERYVKINNEPHHGRKRELRYICE